MRSVRRAVILFTRAPVPGGTKTRLMPYLTGEECAALHCCFIRDIYDICAGTGADVLVYYTPEEHRPVLERLLGRDVPLTAQRGDGLGRRMDAALRDAFGKGYEAAVLVGTDVPQLTAGAIKDAFAALGDSDVVLGPTADGGYYLIGMTRPQPAAWEVRRYGTGTVFDETASRLRRAGLRVAEIDPCRDVDTPEDLRALYGAWAGTPAMAQTHTGRWLAEKFGERREG